MKTATVKQVQGHGENNGYYKWEVALDDGYAGFMFGKKPDCFVSTGEVIEYEAGEYKGGIPKISVTRKVKAASVVHDDTRQKSVEIQEKRLQMDDSKQIMITRQSSLKSAVEWRPSLDLQSLLKVADIMTNYCMTGQIPENMPSDELPF